MPVGQRMWTDSELAVVEQMRHDGATTARIAARIGRSIDSVRGAVRQHRFVLILGRAAQYRDEFARGSTVEEIATRLGVKPNTVRKTRIRLYGTMVRRRVG